VSFVSVSSVIEGGKQSVILRDGFETFRKIIKKLDFVHKRSAERHG